MHSKRPLLRTFAQEGKKENDIEEMRKGSLLNVNRRGRKRVKEKESRLSTIPPFFGSSSKCRDGYWVCKNVLL